MKRVDLRDTVFIKNADPKTLDELKTVFSDIGQFLKNDTDLFYYNVTSCLSQLAKNYLNRYHERNEEEINALVQAYGLDECENIDPYFAFLDELDLDYFEDYSKDKLHHIIGLEKRQSNKDIEEFVELLDRYSDIADIDDGKVIHIAGKDIPVRWAYQKYIEFDTVAWKRIFEHYRINWLPEIMKSKKIRDIPEYSAAEKMLAYYYLDFWYER